MKNPESYGNDLSWFKKIILRIFPGLAGYQHTYYAKVLQVHPALGTHQTLKPLVVCDVRLLDHNFDPLEKFEAFLQVPIMRVSRHITDVPRVEDICLLEFPYWLGSTALLRGILYDGHDVKAEEGTLELSNCDKMILSSEEEMTLGSGEDHMVLANELIPILEELGKMLIEMGSIGNLGAPLGRHSDLSTKWSEIVQPSLENMVSKIKIGKETSP